MVDYSFKSKWDWLSQFECNKEIWEAAKEAIKILPQPIIDWWENGAYGSEYSMSAKEARALSTAYADYHCEPADDIADDEQVSVWNHTFGCERIVDSCMWNGGMTFAYDLKTNSRAITFAHNRNLGCTDGMTGRSELAEIEVCGSLVFMHWRFKEEEYEKWAKRQ